MCTSRLILAGLWLAASALAQPDYLPLQVGNQWIYRSSASDIMTLEVTRASEFQGRRYFLLQGHPGGDAWLRRDENGAVLAFDPDRNQEQTWYAFWNKPGEPYQTFLPGSVNSPAVISSTSALYWGPIGWCNWAMEIQYPGVFQVGIYKELFLPYVGLVRREQAAGGPRMITWDLIYSRLGGVTYVAEQSITFGLALDRYVYRAGGEMTARLTLRNSSWEPVQLEFPSSQTYDLVLKNEKGEIVYRWSGGRNFLEVIRTEVLEYGERNYALLVPLADAAGKPLPVGKYLAEARLTTSAPRSYLASAGFEIR